MVHLLTHLNWKPAFRRATQSSVFKKNHQKPQKLIAYKVKHIVIFHPLISEEDVAHLIKRSGEAGSDNQKSKGKLQFFITERPFITC